MFDAYSKMELLIGKERVDKLSRTKVLVFGLGGVGSYVVEALARCGVGVLTLVDNGVVTIADSSSQLLATRSTVGKSKVQAAKERIADIDEDIIVHTYETFYGNETEGLIDFSAYDYVVDAIDTVDSKILIIENAKKLSIPVISCMDTGNKIDPSKFEIADISKTGACPLAKMIRSELRKRKIGKVKVLYSKEKPVQNTKGKRKKEMIQNPIPGSISFVPAAAGLLIAGEVIRDLIEWRK
ncbi:MAG: tRNA threonylcarbamoyladenosine dehydratase [Eubacteriales bacterium]|nr:tRNA threonylcarbamoyladenosine dehydratase [Eubacteriales bacterium]